MKLKINKPVQIELIEYAINLYSSQIKKMTDEKLEKRAKLSKKSGFREVIVKKYLRNLFVLQYALKKSNIMVKISWGYTFYKYTDKNYEIDS